MLRARVIRPGIVTNEILAALGPEATLLFERLWMLADREGRLEDRPARIRAELFPYWPDFPVEKHLESLCKSEFILRYVQNGCNCIVIINFHKHQHVHPHEMKSTLPSPPRSPAPSTRSNRNGRVRNVITTSANVSECRGTSTSTSTYSGDRKTSDSSEKSSSPAAEENPGKNPPENLPPAAAKTSTQVEAVSTQVAPVRKLPAREEQPPQDGPQQSEDLSILRQSLDSLATELHMPPADDVILHSIFAAGHGATGIEIHEAIKALYHRQRFRSMYSWGLLPLVIAQCFGAQPRARAS